MPYKILLIEQDDDTRHPLVAGIDQLSDELIVVEAVDCKEVIVDIDTKNDYYDLIIVGSPTNAWELYQFVRIKSPHTNFFFLVIKSKEEIIDFESSFFDSPGNAILQYDIGIEKLKKKIIGILPNISPSPKEYNKIKALFFLRFTKTLCDIFIKLSDNKFVKILSKDDCFNASDIEKYIEKGVGYLHIKSQDFDNFHVTFSATPFLVNEGQLDERAYWARSSEIIHHLCEAYGISSSVTKLASESVAKVQKKAQLSPDFYELQRKQRSFNSYLYDHSYLIAIIGSGILRKLQQRSSKVFRDICSAAIFHDITLKDEQSAKVKNLVSREYKTLSFEKKELVKNHPSDVYRLAKNASFISSEASKIILQHHENPDGTGFPDALSAKDIDSMASVFIIAHEFVDMVYESDFDPDHKQAIIDKLKKKYTHKNFVHIVMALSKALKN